MNREGEGYTVYYYNRSRKVSYGRNKGRNVEIWGKHEGKIGKEQ
jgi:hypothetical protein